MTARPKRIKPVRDPAAKRRSILRRKAQVEARDIDRLLYPEAASVDAIAPRLLSECPTVRPCPWMRCRHNLYLEVGEVHTRVGVETRPSMHPLVRLPVHQPWQQPADGSCALDVARRGPHAYKVLARIVGLTDTGVRTIVHRAIRRLRATHPEFAAHLATADAELNGSERVEAQLASGVHR